MICQIFKIAFKMHTIITYIRVKINKIYTISQEPQSITSVLLKRKKDAYYAYQA